MIRLIKGFKDILPGDVELWQHIENTAAQLFAQFGYAEIRIPIMERTELFARSIGEDTDIVEKEMYTFKDRGGEQITLRPEATASVVRSYVQHQMYASDPIRKMYTIGPMFRRERPQKGRYRQFYQINVEAFGIAEAYIDVQLIYMLSLLFERLAVTDIAAHVNSLGCPQCRPKYREALTAFLAEREDQLCADCRRRRTKNPLRVLDCKVPGCRAATADAPELLAYLCADCRAHFDFVQQGLTDLNVPFKVDKRLVRGLDYYTRTTFEIQTGALGAQSAIAGGGRYDGLIKALGGPQLPAIGFAIGFDRLVEVCGLTAAQFQHHPVVFVAALGQASRNKAFGWVCEFAARGIYAEMEFSDKSLKSQMKRANRLNAAYTLILGDNEIAQGEAVLRNMQTRQQTTIRLDDPVSAVCDLLAADTG